MQCTALMSQDHALLRRALDVLLVMVEKLEGGNRIELADISAVLRFLHQFGDEYHQSMEEKILYPALMQAAPQDSALQDMLSQHTLEREFVSAIDAALKGRRGGEFARLARQMVALLREHFDGEDAIVGKAAERYLSEEDDQRIVAEMRRAAAPELVLNFDQLEQKYTKPGVQWIPTERQPLLQPAATGFRAAAAGALSRVFGLMRPG